MKFILIFSTSLFILSLHCSEKKKELSLELFRKRIELIRKDPYLWNLYQKILLLNKEITSLVEENIEIKELRKKLKLIEENQRHQKGKE